MATPFPTWVQSCLSPNATTSTHLLNEARTHFQNLSSPNKPSTQSSVAQDLSHASSSTPNGALVLLVKSLRPVIDVNSNGLSKRCGLNCLQGAIEGCSSLTHGVRQGVGHFLVELCRGDESCDEAYVDGDGLSPEEITAKLQELERSQSGKPSVSSDEARDSAMSCLQALLSSHLDVFPTQQSKSRGGDSLNEALSVLHESMELRLDLAMKGIRFRCTDGVHKEMNGGNGYEVEEFDTDYLTTLPRAKRSICFALLEGALDGFNQDVQRGSTLSSQDLGRSSIPTLVVRTMAKFASLTATCINGETDPRCLLQLLRLLNKVQRVMLPLFEGTTEKKSAHPDNEMQVEDNTQKDPNEMEINNNIQFPSTEIFDAVAPYYPVHFTPPKNDPYKISQSMLHKALMAVLCEDGVTSNTTKSVTNDGEENMIIHSARMFMERLDPSRSMEHHPPSGGEGEEDKFEAVKDLTCLFLVSNHGDNVKDSDNGHGYSSNLTRVSHELLSELSLTLTRVHEESVSGTDAKSIPPSIRQFASSLAHSTELLANQGHKTPWEAFVLNTIQRLSPSLESSSMHGRACTAFLACFAACGGMETLNKVLEGCIPCLLGNRAHDETVSAVRGIAALLSSCRVAMDRWKANNNGVGVYPHPLTPYLSNIIKRIETVFNAAVEGGDEALLLAVVAALESMLTASDFSLLSDDDNDCLVKMFSWMAGMILEEGEENEISGFDFTDELIKSCAGTIGIIVANGVKSEVGDDAARDDKLSLLADKLFAQVMDSATSNGSSSASKSCRIDWIILAAACSNGTEQASHKIVQLILSKAVTALKSSQSDCPPLMALSFICRNGGPNVVKAFHSLKPPDTTYLDIIDVLCTSPRDKNSAAKGQFNVGFSQLKLPVAVTEEEETCNSVIEHAYVILPYLIPAFECSAAEQSFGSLVELLDQVLPPLSAWDQAKFCVIVPLLAAILSNAKDVKILLNSAPLTELESMIGHLSNLVINSKHEKHSRASASSCLSSVFFHIESETLTIPQMINDAVYSSLVESIKVLQSDATNHSAFSRVEEIFNYIGYWGSLGACKGGAHSSCADEIASFLVEMACVGYSSFPFSKSAVGFGPLINKENGKQLITDNASNISILPALAFGNMLSVYNGSPFWRQRIIFKTIPIVMKVAKEEAQSQNPPPCGPLAVCSILFCCPPSLLSEAHSKQMVQILIAGLVHLSKHMDILTHPEVLSSNILDVLGLNLAALVKVLALTPEILTRFTPVVVSSLLRLSGYAKHNDLFFPKQLLALQCLENVANAPLSHNTKLRERDQIVNALSIVVDHPSVMIRQAVVHVRNVWYTLK